MTCGVEEKNAKYGSSQRGNFRAGFQFYSSLRVIPRWSIAFEGILNIAFLSWAYQGYELPRNHLQDQHTSVHSSVFVS